MDYTEVPCRICGVSFNIGRVRRADEPQSASWTSTADGNGFPVATPRWGCQSPGCFLAKRIDESQPQPAVEPTVDKPKIGLEDDDDNENDGDYADGSDYNEEDDDDYEDDSDYDSEAYEYESDDDLVGSDSEDEEYEEEEEEENVVDAEVEVVEAEEGLTHQLLILEKKPKPTLEEGISKPELVPLGFLDKLPVQDQFDLALRYEHVAGPDCTNDRGYNGHRISVEEMIGCNTLQCLVARKYATHPEPDDQDYELRSNYFLSGISNFMPPKGSGHPKVKPARHGLEVVRAAAIVSRPSLRDTLAMPFHPACFDIFIRQSKLHFGRVEVNALMNWFNLERELFDPLELPRTEHVRLSTGELEWNHIGGLEYLAANPLFIPRLDAIIRSAVQKHSTFSTQDGAFDVSNDVTLSKDIFSKLPQELRLQIICYLSSKDIAVLRLVSRSFRQLPISLWRRLLREDMPWLWEIWSEDPPYIWASIPYTIFAKEEIERQKLEDEILTLRNTINEEAPELLDDWLAAEARYLATRSDPLATVYADALATKSYPLPMMKINWFYLYREIKRNWEQLKGLHNRIRIWKEVKGIIQTIRRWRTMGKAEGW